MTKNQLEQLAKQIIDNTTPEETQNFLDLDHEGKRLWTKNKIISLEVQA
ncbi:hypothetical protein J5568_03530 [Streptococcus suis]|uniref:Uncharacterized protein n=1 Tax=Streptococcus suis TaxID=1307 RepID=A0A123UY39_STRSU|nr:hypothetical protein [Streptococcus suis]MBO4131422.1 hypothetical protein [Streptococcus suis]MBO4132915.1 hypothetical protein [Streptococcus suis]MCK4019944.1 hypothetical protein [Streptococcus suis]NQI84480.1 hypothetical protein [Streptococcus suis]NQK17905.1 hypothetical protein [Streptococcus suis]